jgi:hypothetical protein
VKINKNDIQKHETSSQGDNEQISEVVVLVGAVLRDRRRHSSFARWGEQHNEIS